MTFTNYTSSPSAGPIIGDLSSSSPAINSTANPLNQFSADQMYTPIAPDDSYVMFDGCKIHTGYIWPFCDKSIDLSEKDWLLDMWDATQSVGVAAHLFIYHKEHKMMDYVPQFLANPAFMLDVGDDLKSTMKRMLSGKIRNDILYRYQRLLQTSPILFETMDWLDDYWKDYFGSKLFRFGIANAFNFINPENITAEMVHEAIANAKANADKRLRPPSVHQYIQMYEALLAADGGSALVETAELVNIALMSWNLAKRYIKDKELDFNTALAVVMTFIYKRGTAISTEENRSIVETMYEEYGPSDQWPTLDHVLQHVNATTSNRAKKSAAATYSNAPSSALAAGSSNKFD